MWSIGPIEAGSAGELTTRLTEAYDAAYGDMDGDEASRQRAQFDQLSSCLDHQLDWAQGAEGFQVAISGDAGRSEDGRFTRPGNVALRITALDREPAAWESPTATASRSA